MGKKVIIIGVCGGSGSGKTTLARMIKEKFGPETCAILGQDNYYIDQSDRFNGDGGQVNFDHPSAIDFPLMAQHLEKLQLGEDIEVPLYDFATHKRLPETMSLLNHPIIVMDGILILSQSLIFPFFDFSIYLDIDDETRCQRRLHRDVVERGREKEGVQRQLELQVLPMHKEFVSPSAKNADFILQDNGESEKIVQQLFEKFSLKN